MEFKAMTTADSEVYGNPEYVEHKNRALTLKIGLWNEFSMAAADNLLLKDIAFHNLTLKPTT